MSYLDNGDHKFINIKQDNSGMANKEMDTGVKLTALLVVNKDTKADREYGKIIINEIPSEKSDKTKHEFDLRNNSLILMKARRI